MQNLKDICNYLLVKELFIIVICAFIGVVALGIVSFIPNHYMRDHTIESSAFLHNEGSYPCIWGVEESRLDFWTDGLMLNIA